ncbi:MAG: hypothetical protein ACYTG7_20045 [Planctomycetota bacterium]
MEIPPGILPPKGMCIPGFRKMFVDAGGRILPCERVAESSPFILGNIHEGGPDPGKAIEILRRIGSYFTPRCTECIFCRHCVGCVVEFADTSGDFSEAAIDAFCRKQIDHWSQTIRNWTRALEKNPACFDHMEKLSIT